MRRQHGFTLIELLITVAIILVVAALAIPSLLRSRIAANESGAAAAMRMLNTAQISYNSTYPTVGFASTLGALGGADCNPPTSAAACLIDTTLAAGTKSGYTFTLPSASVTSPPNTSYQFIAAPRVYNYDGLHYYCTYSDAVVRVTEVNITSCDGTVAPLD